jgi:DNA-binding IscR family transcriptional regulator
MRSAEAGSGGAAVYAALVAIRLTVPASERGCFYASQPQIGQRAGITGNPVRKYLSELERLGLVKIHRPKGGARIAHDACQYTLIPLVVTGNKTGAHAATKSSRGTPNSPSETSNNEAPDTLNVSPRNMKRKGVEIALNVDSSPVGREEDTCLPVPGRVDTAGTVGSEKSEKKPTQAKAAITHARNDAWLNPEDLL